VIPPNQGVKDLLKLPLVTHQVIVVADITVHHKQEIRDQDPHSPEILRTNREDQSNQECLHPGDPLETRLLGMELKWRLLLIIQGQDMDQVIRSQDQDHQGLKERDHQIEAGSLTLVSTGLVLVRGGL